MLLKSLQYFNKLLFYAQQGCVSRQGTRTAVFSFAFLLVKIRRRVSLAVQALLRLLAGQKVLHQRDKRVALSLLLLRFQGTRAYFAMATTSPGRLR